MISFYKSILNQKRIFGLDIIRAIAITLVMLAHGNFLKTGMVKHLGFLEIGGYFGVELFFVLSGFLIGRILIKDFEEKDDVNFGVLKNFWIRRWFRTLPAYYLILFFHFFLALVFEPEFFQNNEFISYLFFAQNLFKPHPDFYAVAWSLSVEEWFYLTFPFFFLLVYFAVFRHSVGNRVKKAMLVSICSFLVIFFFVRLVNLEFYNLDWLGARKTVVYKFDSIGIGLFFGYLGYYYPDMFRKYKFQFAAIGAVIVVLNAANFYANIWQQPLNDLSFFTRNGYFFSTGLGFACFLPLAYNLSARPDHWAAGFVTILSIVSYSVYLIHFSIIIIAVNKLIDLFQRDSLLLGMIYYSLYVFGSIAVSAVIYKYYEFPMTMLRDKLRPKGHSITRENPI